MLRLGGGQVESLWDEVLPREVRELPEDLAALDVLLRDPALLAPIAAQWQREAEAAGRAVADGRPTISMQTYVRLMVVKHRTGWGYETLMREVVGLAAPAAVLPDRAGGAGAGRVDGPQAHPPAGRRGRRRDHAVVIAKAQRETRFRAAGGEDRLDGRRGGRALSDRLGAGAGRRQRAGARGAQARERRSAATRAGCGIARARSAAACGR